jgi:hypothetical protein
MKIRLLRPCSILLPAGNTVVVDELTAEPLLNAKLVERVEEEKPKLEIPKKEYARKD